MRTAGTELNLNNHVGEYLGGFSQVKKWNRLGSQTRLRPGRALLILVDVPSASAAATEPVKRAGSRGSTVASATKPTRVVHQVKKGDTLYAIATNYNTSVNSIRDWNNLSQNDPLRVGERLTIYLNR